MINLNYQKENNLFNTNPEELNLINEITKDSYIYYYSNNTFNIFKSIYDELCLIYINEYNSIIFYNLIDNKKINEIKNAHMDRIANVRYYFDNINEIDLVISISLKNNIKLWNINNLECLLNLKNINDNGWIFSACLLYDNNKIFIITSNNSNYTTENIKIFDLNGNKLKEVNNSKEKVNFIDIYYDKKISKIYILTANNGFIKSYDYYKNDVYHKYNDKNNKFRFSIIINEDKEIIKLIESCWDGNIRLWNFHTGVLLLKIKISDKKVNDICLWNNENLFVGCEDGKIRLVELKTGKIIKELTGHHSSVQTITKIKHPYYGECLISQGHYNDQIKIWGI